MTALPIDRIRLDGGTQPRAAIDFDAVDDYADAMQEGVKFPPVIVFYDGSEYWLADGFHRVKAAFGAGRDEIEADVRQGTLEDAQWYSFSANKANGLRRTAGDVRRAIEGALRHSKSADLSDNQIARHIGCAQTWVSEVHRKTKTDTLSGPLSENIPSQKRLCADGRTINVSNIGKTRKETVTPETTEAVPSVPPAQPAPTQRVPSPPPPEPVRDSQADHVAMLQAIYALAEHPISATQLVAAIPQENISDLYTKVRAAFEFTGFVFEAAAKRVVN